MGVRRLAMPATVKSSPPRPLAGHRRTAFPRSPLAQTKGIGVGEFEMPFPDAIVGSPYRRCQLFSGAACEIVALCHGHAPSVRRKRACPTRVAPAERVDITAIFPRIRVGGV